MAARTFRAPLSSANRRALGAAVSTIAMLIGVKLVPGRAWLHASRLRTCVYPYAELGGLDRRIAVMRLWQAASHTANSFGELTLYDVLVDTVLEIEAAVGHLTTNPAWLMMAVAAAERSRAEAIARRRGRSIAERELPPRGTSFRSDDRAADRARIAEPIADEPDFWRVAAAAIEGIASGTLSQPDLGPALPWPDELVTAIRATTSAPTYDDLIAEMQPILRAIAIARARDLTHYDDEDADGDGSPSDSADDGDRDSDAGSSAAARGSGGAGVSGGAAAASTDPSSTGEAANDAPASEGGDSKPGAGPAATGDPHPADGASRPDSESGGSDAAPDDASCGNAGPSLEIDPEVLERIASAIAEAIAGELDIDYVVDAVSVVVAAAAEVTREDVERLLYELKPGEIWWDAVSASNAALAEPLKRTITHYLTENEIGELERGTRSGRLDLRRIAAPALGALTPPFRRRAWPDERSYDVMLVVDRSGSMRAGVPGVAEDPAVFGTTHAARWHLATRLLVGVCETLARLDGTRVGVILYDDDVDLVKGLADPLTDACKDRIVAKVYPSGGNDDAAALGAAINAFARSEADKKLIVYLTDGEFCSDRDSVERIVATTAARDIELVLLTVGRDAEAIKTFVPAHLADEITDETVASVLSRHLQRMLEVS